MTTHTNPMPSHPSHETPSPSSPPERLSGDAFNDLFVSLIDPSQGIGRIADHHDVSIIQLADLIEHDTRFEETAAAIERIAAFRERIIAAMLRSEAIERTHAIAIDPNTPTEAARKAAGAILRLARAPRKPSEPDAPNEQPAADARPHTAHEPAPPSEQSGAPESTLPSPAPFPASATAPAHETPVDPTAHTHHHAPIALQTGAPAPHQTNGRLHSPDPRRTPPDPRRLSPA